MTDLTQGIEGFTPVAQRDDPQAEDDVALPEYDYRPTEPRPVAKWGTPSDERAMAGGYQYGALPGPNMPQEHQMQGIIPAVLQTQAQIGSMPVFNGSIASMRSYAAWLNAHNKMQAEQQKLALQMPNYELKKLQLDMARKSDQQTKELEDYRDILTQYDINDDTDFRSMSRAKYNKVGQELWASAATNNDPRLQSILETQGVGKALELLKQKDARNEDSLKVQIQLQNLQNLKARQKLLEAETEKAKGGVGADQPLPSPDPLPGGDTIDPNAAPGTTTAKPGTDITQDDSPLPSDSEPGTDPTQAIPKPPPIETAPVPKVDLGNTPSPSPSSGQGPTKPAAGTTGDIRPTGQDVGGEAGDQGDVGPTGQTGAAGEGPSTVGQALPSPQPQQQSSLAGTYAGMIDNFADQNVADPTLKSLGITKQQLQGFARDYIADGKLPYPNAGKGDPRNRANEAAKNLSEYMANAIQNLANHIDPVDHLLTPDETNIRAANAIREVSKIDPQLARNIAPVLRGDESLYSGRFANDSAWRRSLRDLALAIDPQFSDHRYTLNQKTQIAFQTGWWGQRISASQTTLRHAGNIADSLESLIQGGAGTNVPIGNRIINWFETQGGSGQQISMQEALTHYAQELTRAFRGNSGALRDTERALGEVSANSSPAQIRAFLKMTTALLQGQMETAADFYKRGTMKPLSSDGKHDWEYFAGGENSDLVKRFNNIQRYSYSGNLQHSTADFNGTPLEGAPDTAWDWVLDPNNRSDPRWQAVHDRLIGAPR